MIIYSASNWKIKMEQWLFFYKNYFKIKNQTKQRNRANATFTTTMIESPRGANQPYPCTKFCFQI